MTKVKKERGQIFSIDFLIAAGLAVLAIGMLLNYYETVANAEKESRTQNELAAIAANASSLILERNPCSLEIGFASQGYRVYGCMHTTFTAMSKSDMMIPADFSCNLSWKDLDNGTIQSQTTGAEPRCTNPVPPDRSMVSVDRNFLAQQQISLTKKDYENCIYGLCSTLIYHKNVLTLKVWK